MATARASGYVVTHTVWNAVLAQLTDDGGTYSGAFNGSTVAGTTGSFSSTLAVTGAVTMGSTLALTAAGGTIKERARTTPMGEWIAVTFSAGDFTADGGVGSAWTVASGDVADNRYMLVGKTLWYSVRVATSTVGGSPTSLRVAIPGGFTANATTSVACGYMNDAGTSRRDVLVEAGSGVTYVSIQRDAGTAFADATNTTYVYFVIPIEIQ